MIARRRAALLFALVVASLAGTGCETAAYLAEQGRGQLAILRARRRIAEVLTDPAVDGDTKARLRLASEARAFGVRVLGLRGGDSFTRYVDTHGEPVAWSVYAAYRDRLAPYLHRFPIAGAVPYLGFFDKASAVREKARLDARGLDTYLVGVAGYSTLGFTSDPVFSSMIEGPPARIVEVVLHEMLHGTLYRPGESEWNESLATVVGLEGARLFFAERGDQGGARASAKLLVEAREHEARAEAAAAFFRPVIAELEALYAEPVSAEEKIARRAPILARAVENYRARFPMPPAPEGAPRPPAFSRQPLNNAVLLSYTTYHRGTGALRAELLRTPGGLPAFIARYKARYAP